jgi:hypothetical protein
MLPICNKLECFSEEDPMAKFNGLYDLQKEAYSNSETGSEKSANA